MLNILNTEPHNNLAVVTIYGLLRGYWFELYLNFATMIDITDITHLPLVEYKLGNLDSLDVGIRWMLFLESWMFRIYHWLRYAIANNHLVDCKWK